MKTVNETCTEDGCDNPIDNPTPSSKYCEPCRVRVRKKQSSDHYLSSRNGVQVTRGKNVEKTPIKKYWLERGPIGISGGKLFG